LGTSLDFTNGKNGTVHSYPFCTSSAISPRDRRSLSTTNKFEVSSREMRISPENISQFIRRIRMRWTKTSQKFWTLPTKHGPIGTKIPAVQHLSSPDVKLFLVSKVPAAVELWHVLLAESHANPPSVPGCCGTRLGKYQNPSA